MAIKNIIIICVLLFFAAGEVCSQTSPLSKRRDSLIVAITTMANVPPGGSDRLTPAKLNLILNLTYSDICRELPSMERYDTIVITTTLEGALLPTDFNRMIGVFRKIDSTARVPLQPLPDEGLITVFNSADKNKQKNKNDIMSPGYYKKLERRLFFYPKWSKDTVQTYIIHYFGMATPLASNSDTVTIDPMFIPALIFKAAKQVAAIRQDEYLRLFYDAEYEKIKAEYRR